MPGLKNAITDNHDVPKFSDRQVWEYSVDPDQTAPRVAVWYCSYMP